MKVGIEVRGDLREILRSDLRRAKPAVTRAVAAAGLQTQGDLRVRTAPLGQGVANAWRLQLYPRGQPSLGAAASVFTRAPRIIDGFSRGTSILPQPGGSLSIPTPAAIARMGGRKRFTPREFTQRTGIELRHVYRRGKPSLLVGDDVRAGAGGRFLRNTVTRSGRTYSRVSGRATAVFFILLQGVRLRRLLNLDDAARSAANLLQANVSRALEEALG